MKERLFLIRILPIAFLVICIAMITQIVTCNLNVLKVTLFSSPETSYQQLAEFWTLEQLKQLKKGDILYATTFGNSCKIYLKDNVCIGYYGGITKLYDEVLREKRLPKIHQSFIVNDSISSYTFTKNLRGEKKYTVHINGNKKLPVSKEYNGLVDFLIKPR